MVAVPHLSVSSGSQAEAGAPPCCTLFSWERTNLKSRGRNIKHLLKIVFQGPPCHFSHYTGHKYLLGQDTSPLPEEDQSHGKHMDKYFIQREE
jgi:hypothetical protein